MTRSRLVVLLALIVVGFGVMAAVGALVLDPARAAVGPLPAEGLALPAQARFVAGIDVQRLMASPIYQKLLAGGGGPGLDLLQELEKMTGVDPRRDVEQILVAGGGKGDGEDGGVVLALGSFDPYALGRAIEGDARDGVTWQDFRGTTVYLFGEEAAARWMGLQRGPGALALLDERALVLGSESAVEATIASRSDGEAPFRSNETLMGLLARVEPGAAFWMVGDETLLAQMRRAIPALGGGSMAPSLTLPALTSLVVSGHVDPLLAFKITGEAADEAAAGRLADLVRGATALATLHANSNPELGKLASAISVTTEANRVHVNARVSYELVEALLAGPTGVADVEAEGAASGLE